MASVTIALQGVPTWTEQGPGPIVDGGGKIVGTGAIVAIAAHPAEGGTIYAAAASGGVWRTLDATRENLSPAWEPLTDAYPSTAMGAIAFSRLDATHRTLFAGTGTFSSFGPSGPAVGLYRSIDGGETWAVVGGSNLAGKRIRSVVAPVAIPGATGQVVLVAALHWLDGGNNNTLLSPGGVYRSKDNGNTFVSLSASPASNLPAGEGWALVEDPGKAGRIYAAIGPPGTGVYRSDDAGLAWTAANNGIDPGHLSAAEWIRLAIGPGSHAQASTLYAGIINGGQLVGLYRTSALPGQEHWTEISLRRHSINPQKEGVWKFALAADPSRPVLFVGGDTGGIWRVDLSAPESQRWKKVSKSAETSGLNVPQAAPHDDCQDLVFDAGGDLLAATDGGIYRLANPNSRAEDGRARKWEHIGGRIRNNEFLAVAYDTLAHIVAGGSGDNGTSYQRHPGDRTWLSTQWGDGGDQEVDNDHDHFSWRYSVLVETAGVDSLQRRTFDASDPLGDPEVHNVALSGITVSDKAASGSFVLNNLDGYRSRMLVAANVLYESFDGGDRVKAVHLVGIVPAGVDGMAYGALENGVPKPEVAYVGIGGTLWLRRPGATSFSQLKHYPGHGVNDVAVDVYNWQLAYAVDNTHVWRTEDAGATWTECTGNLLQVVTDAQTGTQFRCVLVYRPGPDSIEEAVLVGATGGLFRTLNAADGASALWTKFGSNLPNTVGRDIKYYPRRLRGSPRRATGDVLVASLLGRGAWVLENASANLVKPAVLRITGHTGRDTIRLVRNPNVPAMLDVYDQGGAAGPRLSLPLASLRHIIVQCRGDQDVLVLDCSNGPISVPGRIVYRAAAGTRNALVLTGGSARTQRFSLTSGPYGGSLMVDTMAVEYGGIQRIDTTIRCKQLTIETAGTPEAFEVSNGPPLDGRQSMQVRHRWGDTPFELNFADAWAAFLDMKRAAVRLVVDRFRAAPTQLSRLTVLTGAKPNDIQIASTPVGVETEIRGAGGSDFVTIGTVTGSGGQLANVLGPIHVSNQGGKTALSISNADDLASTSAEISDRSVSGLGPVPITFEPGDLSSLSVLGSKGGTTFTVEDTGGFTTALFGEGFINVLHVHGTTGPLEYTTRDSIDIDTVVIGAPGSGGRGADVASIRGPVRVRCSPVGNVNVMVDDSGNGQPKEVTITDHAVLGLAPAAIELFAGSTPYLNSLTINGGRNRTFYSVIETPPMFSVSLHGQGADIVNVYRTHQRLKIEGAEGVTVGSAPTGVSDIRDEVWIGPNPSSTTVTIDDRSNPHARTVAIDATAIAGLTPKPIRFGTATLRALHVSCGDGDNTINIDATIPGFSTLRLGQGRDAVNVRSTSGPLYIAAHPGSLHRVVVGSHAPGIQKDELDTITGEVRIAAPPGAVDLVVSDAKGLLARRAEMTSTEISHLAPAVIAYGPLQLMAIQLSPVGNYLSISSTPPGGSTRVRTGGHDTLAVKISENSLCDLVVEGPTESEDTLEIVVTERPEDIEIDPPVDSTPGLVRVKYTSEAVSVISYRNIGRVILPE